MQTWSNTKPLTVLIVIKFCWWICHSFQNRIMLPCETNKLCQHINFFRTDCKYSSRLVKSCGSGKTVDRRITLHGVRFTCLCVHSSAIVGSTCKTWKKVNARKTKEKGSWFGTVATKVQFFVSVCLWENNRTEWISPSYKF